MVVQQTKAGGYQTKADHPDQTNGDLLMIGKLRTYLKEGFSYTGLEFCGSEEARSFFILELKKTKNRLVVIDKKELNAFEQLPEVINKKNPLFLCINTPNVLTKKVGTGNGTNLEAMVNQAFPNIDLNSIYYEVAQKDNDPFVVISKKGPVDSILKSLKDLDILVYKFSLGVVAMENIAPFIADETVRVSNQDLHIPGTSITGIRPINNQDSFLYSISGLELPSAYLLPFSQILGNLNQKAGVSNFNAINEALKSSFKNFRIFDRVLKYALIFFVALLLTNFLFYSHYHKKVGSLNESLAATSSQKDELTLLEESVKRKQERVETLSASSNSKATYYLDTFAQRIPNSILLNEIKYQPLAKPVREKKPIMLEEEVLLVSGISKDVDVFSLWIEELEKQEWVNSVETLDYNYVGRTTSNFLIEIGFHEDR